MLSLEAIAAGTGYTVLALLLGVLVSAGFLLPAGEPKALRRTFMLAGGYLVRRLLDNRRGLPLDPGRQASAGRRGVLRCSSPLRDHDPKRQSLAPARSLRSGAGGSNILAREKRAELKTNTPRFLSCAAAGGQPQFYQPCGRCERGYDDRSGCRSDSPYRDRPLGRGLVSAILGSLSRHKKNDSTCVLGSGNGASFLSAGAW